MRVTSRSAVSRAVQSESEAQPGPVPARVRSAAVARNRKWRRRGLSPSAFGLPPPRATAKALQKGRFAGSVPVKWRRRGLSPSAFGLPPPRATAKALKKKVVSRGLSPCVPDRITSTVSQGSDPRGPCVIDHIRNGLRLLLRWQNDLW